MEQLDLDILRYLDGEMSLDEELKLVETIKNTSDGESRLMFLVQFHGQLPAVFSESAVKNHLKQIETLKGRKKPTTKFNKINKSSIYHKKEKKTKNLIYIFSGIAASLAFCSLIMFHNSSKNNNIVEIPAPINTPKFNESKKMKIIKVDGFVWNSSGKPWSKMKPGMVVESGEAITIIEAGSATFKFENDETAITISNKCSLIFEHSDQGNTIKILRGLVVADVAKQDTTKPLKFSTGEAEATVLGTKLRIDKTEEKTTLDVLSGSVEFRRIGHKASVKVNSKQFSTISAKGSEDPNVKNFPLGAQGQIILQRWFNIGTSELSALKQLKTYPNSPDSELFLSTFEIPANSADNYGSRIAGMLHAPETGEYTFWISGDYKASLSLSSDDSPRNLKEIAKVENWTHFREWNKEPVQQSKKIRLEKGKAYFIEALQIDDKENDSLTVFWEGPGITREIIPGRYLSPSH